MNWWIKAMTNAESGTVEVAETEVDPQTSSSQGITGSDWLCAWCLNHIASEKNRFLFNGKSEFVFMNPEGIRFSIITFSQTIGCRQAGVPTLEYTWFPDYAWSLCICNRCDTMLGWYYSGPSIFVGLIRNRIVLASVVLN